MRIELAMRFLLPQSARFGHLQFMKRPSSALLVFGLCFAGSAALAGPELKMLNPGPIQAEDFGDYQVGGRWLALHAKNREWRLSIARVSVVKDDIGNFNIGSSQPNTIILLQDQTLQSGPVEAAKLISTTPDQPARAFEFKGSRYSLVVHKVQTPDEVRNDVYLTDGTRRTLVYGGKDSGRSCDHPAIQWAGDLDRDGKPDFIANFDDDSQKNGSVCVFLSSRARGNALTGKAACQSFSG